MLKFLAAVLLLSGCASAQDALAASGLEHFYNLDFTRALADFRAEVAQDPDLPDGYNHIAQTILYREMFRSGALESQLVTGTNPFLRREKMNPSAADENEFNEAVFRALSLSGARLLRNPDDLRALYAQGVAYGLRANYKFLVRKAWIDALRDATTARKAHNRATEIDPAFIDARLIPGVYDYMVGSLPWGWKLLGFLGGYRGDRDRGIQTLQLAAAKGKLNRSDAAVLLCAIYRRESRPQDAVVLLNELIQRFPRNFLLRLELVQMHADLGEKEKALAVIREVELFRSSHAPGYQQLSEETLRYTRGTVLFWYDEVEPALADMKAVTAKAETLDLNTGVYAWLRLGQLYDIQGDRKQALATYQQALRYAPESDAATEARRYLGTRYTREIRDSNRKIN